MTTQDNKIAIMGGGIGGMALAASLHKLGMTAHVYERSPQLQEVGSGLGLWSNAIRVLDWLGLTQRMLDEQLGHVIAQGCFSNSSGRELSKMQLTGLLGLESLGAGSRGMILAHRAELLALLASAVPVEWVQTSAACASVEASDGAPVRVRFEDGAQIEADVVVGADGLWSKVRSSLHGEERPRYGGEACWRGVCELASFDHWDCLREVQGGGKRMGICPLTRGRIYWWFTEPSPEGSCHVEQGQRRAYMDSLMRGWPEDARALVQATAEEDILRHDLYDRPPLSPWRRGGATLLGDAAHPTTPNLGQGAAMAIEDAATLALLLAKGGDVAATLDRYEQLRRPRCSKIVSLSRLHGQIGQWRNPLATRARELMLSMTPDRAIRAALRDQLGYDAIAAAS